MGLKPHWTHFRYSLEYLLPTHPSLHLHYYIRPHDNASCMQPFTCAFTESQPFSVQSGVLHAPYSCIPGCDSSLLQAERKREDYNDLQFHQTDILAHLPLCDLSSNSQDHYLQLLPFFFCFNMIL